MSKTITIQFTVTTPYQVVYDVKDDFSFNSSNVNSAIEELSYSLGRDILEDFEKEEDREKEDGYAVTELIEIDFIEIKNSNEESEIIIKD